MNLGLQVSRFRIIDESGQLDLFDRPIEQEVKRLTFNQSLRLFQHLYWNKVKMSKNTASFIRYMMAFFDGRHLETIGRQDVENLCKHLSRERGLGASGVNKGHMILTLMFNKFEQWKQDGWAGGYNFEGILLPRKNPGQMVKKAREPFDDRFFSPWEFRVWIRLSKKLGDWHMTNILRLGVWLRLSPIDLANLNDAEIDEQNMQIRVFRRHTKTDKNPQGCLQIIDITEKVWGLIQTCRRHRNPGENLILNFRNDRRRLARLRKLVRAEGYRDFTWRHLRKAGSGHLFRKGYDIGTIADGMGHVDPRTTKTYYVPKGNPKLRAATQTIVEDFNG